MTLTKEAIREILKSIQNRFNKHRFSDEDIEGNVIFIFQDKEGNERPEEKKKSFLSIVCHENYRELDREYPHIIVAKNKTGRYFIYIKRKTLRYPVLEFYLWERFKDKIDELVYKHAEAYNKILEEGFVTGEVEFPTGEVIFANFFRNSKCDNYAFDMPEDLEYSEFNSINHSLGEQNTMGILSKTHGLGYVQFGNTSATVYKVNDDKLVITSSYMTDPDTGDDIDARLDLNWQELGSISCEVWRVEFIDQANFDKNENALPLDDTHYKDFDKPFKAKVNPGIWTIKNRYHFIDDDKELRRGNIPIWVEIERKK